MIGQTISHYRILEKLGEGGMGVVYKAHDTKLDRIVALKFLPHYLTTDASERERFYHEAKAASALNHPNITTIHEINEFEHQIFIAMEFVEGKTLKALVGAIHVYDPAKGGESPLPIKKILDIAIQVCDGLAAAHEKGIVHRDIKADNIMLTAKGQVKIMDFGLAKVKGATKLTKAGSTLGTAAYMSPEQAQGEEVDHRSDIFSFGVVMYELVTGKLPFRGEHQAALMYSLMNENPQPVARFNEKVSPEIERIVMKSLAKDPEDRYQHVDDLLADVRRERKNLEYAKAGYARTSTITQAIPVVEKPKRAWQKYLVAAALVILVGILTVVFNPFNLQISTQKSAAASEKSSLAVMYFENIPDPEDKDHTGEMLTNLLTTSLFQTKNVEVISRERLYDIQKDLGQADIKAISPAMATKVAERAGVSMMLLGSILQKQPSLVITYRLIEVQSGKLLSTQRLSDYSPDKIFSLVDTLALLVKNDLHITPSASLETKSVASVTTTSPEAYRCYLEGVELSNRYYVLDAKAAFRRAIELDSNFAAAYVQLAIINRIVRSTEEFNHALRKAYERSDRVTERERLGIQSFYASEVGKNIPQAISILENLLQKYPHEQQAYIGLGINYQKLAQFEKMSQTFVRGLQVDSLDKNLWNLLAYSSAGLNRREEAFRSIDRYLQLAPAEPNPYDSKGDIYSLFDDRDSADIWWRKAVSFRADFLSWGKLAYSALMSQDYEAAENYFRKYAASIRDEKQFNQIIPVIFLIRRGQMEKARTQSLSLLASHRAQKLHGWTTGDLEVLVRLDYELHDYPAMVEHAQEGSDELRKDPGNVLYGRVELAFAQLKNGNLKAASMIMDEVKDAVGAESGSQYGQYEYGMALLAFEQGKFDVAIEHFKTAMKSFFPNRPPLYLYAVCLLKTGHPQEAMQELRRLIRWAPIDNPDHDLTRLPMADAWFIANVKAHYWLAVAYEQQGQNEEAIKEYEKFLEIWQNADSKSPEMEDAKVRLAKLKEAAAK